MSDPNTDLTPMPREGLIPDPRAPETEKILGTAAHPSDLRQKLPPTWHRLYDKLIEARDAMIDATMDMQSKAREIQPDPLQDSPAEIGTTNFQRDQLLGMVTFDQETLEEINFALSRMENGTYGICEATGKPIPQERLEAIPWARFSVEAERELEARGEATQAAIGARGDMRERGTAPAGAWRDKEGST